MCSVGMIPEIYRSRCIVIHNRSGFNGCLHNGLVGIVYNELFSKGIDKMFQSAAYSDAVRSESGELNGITQQIAPESSIGTDHQGIIFTQLHIFQANRL